MALVARWWVVQREGPDYNGGRYVVDPVSFIVFLTSPVGSVSYGILDLAFPKDSSLLAQKLWASIGWSMG